MKNPDSILLSGYVFKPNKIVKQKSSPQLKHLPKRCPKSKAGKLLVSVASRLMLIVSADYELYGTISDGAVLIINRLVDRIQGHLDRELKKLYPQVALFQNYSVTFIKPKRKRKTTEIISATSMIDARRLVMERYGEGTRIT